MPADYPAYFVLLGLCAVYAVVKLIEWWFGRRGPH